MKTLLIATTNPGKMLEMKNLFEMVSPHEFFLVIPQETGIQMEVAEDGQTYQENASKKALAFCQASGLPTLADDSGLEVAALDGRPGMYSARYTGTHTLQRQAVQLSDAGRRAALLRELHTHPRPWLARFFCSVAVALPDGALLHTQGECQGEIIPEERGTNGFGYDPIFQIGDPAYADLTMAQLSLEQKNRVSHRAMAVRRMIDQLR